MALETIERPAKGGILQNNSLLTFAGAGLTMAILVFCASQIGSTLQLIVGLFIIVILLVLKRMDMNLQMRILFMLLGLFLALSYMTWRTFQTLAYYDIISFTCALLLYLAELYGFIVYGLSIFVNLDPLSRKPAPLPENEAEWPTVDVIIPSYNEDRSILEVTIMASLQIDYPKEKLRVWLCDDGGTDQRCNDSDPDKARTAQRRRTELTEMCRTLGAHYVTRERNLHAKAGNINSCLTHSRGELVLILDADHVPTRDILRNTVGWFIKEPKMFLVQTPHFFANPDPLEKNLETFEQMPSENEMFYKVIQKGLDYWNSAFFCGSAAVLRRTLLEKVGGISGDTITEDAETALHLHAEGYESAYIERPMISGLSPETLGSFIGQRIRWAQGMIQIFLLKNPLLISGLTIPQRLCYFSSCFFWFFAFARVIFILAPCAFLLFGLRIYYANFYDFTAFAVPYIISVMIVSDYLFGKVRWTFVSELYELIQAVYSLPAIIKVFMNPRAPTFNVTTKGETLDQDFISPLARPFYLFFFLNILAMGFGVYKLAFTTVEVFPTIITMAWALFNIFILLACLGVLLERRQRRASARTPSDYPASLVAGGKILESRIIDLSIGGASLAVDPVYEHMLQREMRITLRSGLPGEIATDFHTIVRSVRDDNGELLVGVQFDSQSLEEAMRKVALVNGSSARWMEFQARRERKIGVSGSIFFLAANGIRQSIAHFGHLLLGLTRTTAPAGKTTTAKA